MIELTKSKSRSNVVFHITSEICCNDHMNVFVKKFFNHFRISRVCRHCEHRDLFSYNLQGKLIKTSH